jgi:hypothetical protein
MLGNAIDKVGTSRIVQVLEGMLQWRQILTALTRLSDHLAADQVPIDYQRRRTLDYESLLPDTEWEHICRVTGASRGTGYKAHIVRAYLFQRLSTLPCDAPPAGVATTPAEFRASLALFPTRLFPGLAAALDETACDFLARHRIRDEPVIWHPPVSLLGDLDLPGPDPSLIDVTRLHELVRGRRHSAQRAAGVLGTTIDAVRLVLDEHPAPAAPLTASQARATGRVRHAARGGAHRGGVPPPLL